MARRPSARSRKPTTVTVNFKGVETFTKMDEGEHLLTIEEAEVREGDKGEYIAYKLVNEDGAAVWHNISLSENSLWNAKAWLEALGQEVPDEEVEIDPSEHVELQLMATIELETYEGKKKPRIVDFWPAEGEEPKKPSRGSKKPAKEEEEEEQPRRGAGKDRGKKKPEPKEPEAPTDEELDDMSEDELADVVKEHDLDVDLDKFRTLRKKIAAVKDALAD